MTARKRASAASAAFGRALGPAPQSAAEPEPEAVPVTRPKAKQDNRLKYTLLLDPDEAGAFDEVTIRLRRKLVRRVDKAEVLRAMISMLADDPSLLNDLSEQMRR